MEDQTPSVAGATPPPLTREEKNQVRRADFSSLPASGEGWGGVKISLILGILLLAFALRMWQLNAEPIWHDEGWSIRAIHSPFGTPDDNTPYLYYATLHLLWRLGGGDTPLALRYGSVLLGLITVALAIAVGKRWFGYVAGLGAGVLVATSPLLWEYAQEVRAYVVVPIIALVLLYCAGEILKYQKGEIVPRRLWGIILVAQVLGLYTHNLTVPLIVWLNVTFGIVWLLRFDLHKMFSWAGRTILILLFYLPWASTQAPSGTPLNSPPEVGLGLVREVWYAYFLPVIQQLRQTESTALLNLFGVITIGAGVILIFTLIRQSVNTTSYDQGRTPRIKIRGYGFLKSTKGTEKSTTLMGFDSLAGSGREDWKTGWLLISHALLVPIFSTALILVAHIDFHPRYYVASVPGTVLLIVAGLMSLRAWLPYRVVVGAIIAVVMLGIAVSADSLHTITTTRAYQHDDFAGLADYYATLPEDTVILIPFNSEPALQVYYTEQANIQAQFVNVPLYSDETTVIETINQLYAQGTRHIEFLTWFQLPADVRGMYPCLLNAISTDIGEPRLYFGLQTQSFTIDAPIVWQPLDLNPTYREVTLQDADYLAESPYGVCVRTTWTLNQPTDEIINVAGAILNPLGDEIARADTVMADDDNVTTQNWSASETGSAYTWLPLPVGAPLTQYGFALNVYTASASSGFDVFDEDGNPVGVTVIAPSALTAQGRLLINNNEQAEIIEITGINPESNTLETGRAVEFTLMLPPSESGTAEVSLRGDDWELRQTATINVDSRVLAWHSFIVPPGNSGEVGLFVNDDQIATFIVVDVARELTAPQVDTRVDVTFAEVGRLYGVNVATTMNTAETPQVTLIWQATETSSTAYTVFVQLLAEDGRVLAQSDAQPVQGERPTTGWVDGEYISDTHILQWNISDYTGNAHLIAGFYDANNGFRRVLLLDNATDFATIDVVITID